MAETGDIEQIEDATLVAVANYKKDYATLGKYMQKDIKNGGKVWTDSKDLLPLLMGMSANCKQDKKLVKLMIREAELRIKLLKEKDAANPGREVTVGDVKMTPAQFLINNFQKIIDGLK